MPEPDIQALLGMYAAGSLSERERERLTQEAANDQSTFDQLAEEESLRLAFADPVFRGRITARLRAAQRERGRSWKAFFLPAAAMAMVAIVAFFAYRAFAPVPEMVVALDTSVMRQSYTDLAVVDKGFDQGLPPDARQLPGASGEAQLSLDRPGDGVVYRTGDPMRIGFRVASSARVLLVEQLPDGTEIRLFPNRFQSSTAVPAGEVLVPPSGQGNLTVEGPAGARTMRLYVFPASAPDPLSPLSVWDELKKNARVVVRKYEVQP